MTFDNEPVVLDKPTYIPDQELYPGETYSSYAEMKAACPLLEVRSDESYKKNIQYTPYRVTYEKAEA